MQISNGDTPCDAPIMSDAPPHLSCLPNVEEPMKYQALRPQFFSVGRWWWGGGSGVGVGDGGVGVCKGGVGRGVCGRVGMGGVVGWG